MAVPQHVRGPSPLRMLTSLKKNLEEFKTDNVAKLHFNVVREPLFRIPIDQVRNYIFFKSRTNNILNKHFIIIKSSNSIIYSQLLAF